MLINIKYLKDETIIKFKNQILTLTKVSKNDKVTQYLAHILVYIRFFFEKEGNIIFVCVD
jgi:hypothetical protein